MSIHAPLLHFDLSNRMDLPKRGTQTLVDPVLILGIEHQPAEESEYRSCLVLGSCFFNPNFLDRSSPFLQSDGCLSAGTAGASYPPSCE